MKSHLNQSGSAAVAVVLVLMVAAVAAVVLLRVNQAHQASQPPAAQSSVATGVPVAPQVNSTQDLDKASGTLDQVDLDADSSDSSQLDGQLSAF